MSAEACATCLPASPAREKVLFAVGAVTLSRVACACKELNADANNDALWQDFFRDSWPHWTLLEPAAGQQDVSFQRLFALRSLRQLPMQAAQETMHLLRGSGTDNFDGNVTPLSANMCFLPGQVVAEVTVGAGTIHNTPSKGIWLGSHTRGTDGVELAWVEALPTERGLWVYEGTVDSDGRSIRGTYYLKLLPRKRGTFELTVCPPDPALPVPSLAELCLRIWRVYGARA